jgi:hypothetical protein
MNGVQLVKIFGTKSKNSINKIFLSGIGKKLQTMHTVLNDVFPVGSLKCCRLHLRQDWYRKMQNLGLSQDYKDSESAIGKWLKQSFGLQFLDPTEVEDCFVEEYMASAPQDEPS